MTIEEAPYPFESAMLLRLSIYGLLLSHLSITLCWSVAFQDHITQGRDFDARLRSGQCRKDNTTTVAQLQSRGWEVDKNDGTDQGGYKLPPGAKYVDYLTLEAASASTSHQWLDYKNGIIVALFNVLSDGKVRWSKIVGAQWRDGAANNEEVKGLRHIKRDSVTNTVVTKIMDEVAKFYPPLKQGVDGGDAPPWRLSQGHDVYYAILDSPNGRGILHLLNDEPLLHHLVVDYIELRNETGAAYGIDVYLKVLGNGT